MAEVSLQGAGVMALIGKLEAAGMPKHVRVSLERQLSRRASALDHTGEASRGERGSTL